MSKLHVVKPKHSLIYSMKLLKNVSLEDWKHQHLEIQGPEGEAIPMVFHMISGTKEEIREQFLHSIDAFFDLADDLP